MALRRTLLFALPILAVAAMPASASRSVQTTPALGVQFHCNWPDYTDGSRAQVLDKLAAVSLTWVRIDVSWAELKPRRLQPVDRRYSNRFDRCLTLAHERGFKVLATLGWSPRWANGGRGAGAPPLDPRDYARIARWASRHWRGRVDAWEVWNEPNLHGSWAGSAARYVRMLRLAFSALKRGDPRTTVVFGGLSGTDDRLLAKAYAAGAHGWFDVLATHPYQGVSDAPPEHPDDGERWWITHVESIRALMDAKGDAAKPIWFTESGWSAHANEPGTPAWRLGVTEAAQADYAARFVRLVRDRYPYVTNVFWYDERSWPGEGPHLGGFGLLRTDLTPRPVYWALRDALAH